MDITKVCRDLNELEPSTKYLAEKFLEECKRRNIDVLITETYRSPERQKYLYSFGRTRAGNKVTWTLHSRHISRKAFDFVPLTNGHCDWSDISKFRQIGEIGKSLGLTWGGDWTHKDYPHLQYDGKPIDFNSKKKTWQEETLDKLVEDGLVNSPEYWKSKWGENISVQDAIGLIGSLIYRVK